MRDAYHYILLVLAMKKTTYLMAAIDLTFGIIQTVHQTLKKKETQFFKLILKLIYIAMLVNNRFTLKIIDLNAIPVKLLEMLPVQVSQMY